ncbi:sulfur carrier protein ThiS [Candidatus Woesearchaeota archaeon]|nr:sulfur carrier protein ThiS [Candidatus Woesearchaeota archaeon]
MKLRINGEERTLAAKTVADVIDHLQLKPEQVVVELNKNIVKREEYGKTDVKDGDTLEIVTLVGGG